MNKIVFVVFGFNKRKYIFSQTSTTFHPFIWRRGREPQPTLCYKTYFKPTAESMTPRQRGDTARTTKGDRNYTCQALLGKNLQYVKYPKGIKKSLHTSRWTGTQQY
jgi:hypothetical protein